MMTAERLAADWMVARCPCQRATLGEVRGVGGEVRRVCPKCRAWWIIDVATGAVRPDPAQPTCARN